MDLFRCPQQFGSTVQLINWTVIFWNFQKRVRAMQRGQAAVADAKVDLNTHAPNQSSLSNIMRQSAVVLNLPFPSPTCGNMVHPTDDSNAWKASSNNGHRGTPNREFQSLPPPRPEVRAIRLLLPITLARSEHTPQWRLTKRQTQSRRFHLPQLRRANP